MRYWLETRRAGGGAKERGPSRRTGGNDTEMKNINPSHNSATTFGFRHFGITHNYSVALCSITMLGFSNKTIRQSEEHPPCPTSLSAHSSCIGQCSPCHRAACSVCDTWQEKGLCAEQEPGLPPWGTPTPERVCFASAAA